MEMDDGAPPIKYDPRPGINMRVEQIEAESARFRAGLEIIKEAGAIHGGAWCAAQARGYLEDLDFDMYPETGKPPR